MLEGPAELARAAAELFVQLAGEAVRVRGRFTVALAGGSTPEKAYELLAGPEYSPRIDWQHVYFFFSDERFVPPADERSNHAMAARALFSKAPIPAGHVIPVNTAVAAPADAAAGYAAELGRFFSVRPGESPPVFDLILLGMGDDGHTASLFPGKPALADKGWVTWSTPGVLPPPVDRVTFTFPQINAGRRVAFLMSGEKKAGVVKELLEGKPRAEAFPSAGVKPTDGELIYLLDRGAATALLPFTTR